jgi:hypothetical protein
MSRTIRIRAESDATSSDAPSTPAAATSSSPTLATTAHWLRDVDPRVRVKVIGFRRHGVRATARRWPEATPEQITGGTHRLAAAGISDIEAVWNARRTVTGEWT